MKILFKCTQLYLAVLIITMLVLNSCISQKKTIYLNNKSKYSAGSTTYENDMSVYKVRPGDFLYINVSSLDPKNLTTFEGNERNEYQLQSEMSIYLKSFQVNDSGFITFPVVGKIEVAALSVNEIRNKLQSIMDDFYQLTTVTVKLVNFKISLMGEIIRPGTYAVYQDRLNIFQALSMGGDMTVYGNRRNVNIIRKTNNGGTEILKINLLSDSLLELPGYYLQPDDVIYVEPMKSKNFAFTAFPYSIVLSTITTTLLIMNFFK
ncbi:MAG: polysaccharide biosynthesis/export family protein [Omnitrophica WOR_2 bacterium]